MIYNIIAKRTWLATTTLVAKEILAKLQETLQSLLMREEMRSQMQDLLHEFPLAKEETRLEWPLSGTPDLL